MNRRGGTGSLGPPVSARRRYVAPSLLEVNEYPKTPTEVAIGKEVARRRRDELQDIFTSRHSERCDALRARLAALDGEERKFRDRIAFLEEELKEAQVERMAKDEPSTNGPAAQGDDIDRPASPPESVRHGPKALHHASTWATAGSSAADRRGTFGAGSGDGADAGAGEEKAVDHCFCGNTFIEDASFCRKCGRKRPQKQPELLQVGEEDEGEDTIGGLYNQEVLSPLLQRRRAEARFKEATLCHENTVIHMKNELQVIERRMHKQQVWMKHVDSQVLKTEIAKARYQVRLDNAERRTKQLGKDLSNAYEDMTHLLKERLDVEGIAAHNDALVNYIDHIGKADKSNAENFIENRVELTELLEVCRKSHETRRTFEAIMEEVSDKEMLTSEVLEHTETLTSLNEQLHKLWVAVPATLKESAFRQTTSRYLRNGADGDGQKENSQCVHPTTALQNIAQAAGQISQSCRHYTDMLSQARERETEIMGVNDGPEGNLISKALDEILYSGNDDASALTHVSPPADKSRKRQGTKGAT